MDANNAISNDQQVDRKWELEMWRAPTLAPDDELMYCEPGRILYRTEGEKQAQKPGSGTDCRSHWFRVVKNGGLWFVLVKHGAGEERIRIGYSYRNFPACMDPLSSDARYWLLFIMHDIHGRATRAGSAATADEYRRAFVDGRLKKRKVRGSNSVKVWIE